MSGINGEQPTRSVTDALRQQVVSLESEIDHLRRLQADGPIAAIASTIVNEVEGWADDGLDPTKESGFGTALDPAIDRGIEAATTDYTGIVLRRLKPEAAVSLIQGILGVDRFRELAATALEKVIKAHPVEVLRDLNPADQKSILGPVLGDQALASLLSTSTEKPEAKATAKDNPKLRAMQEHYERFGWFSLKGLEEGDKVTLLASAQKLKGSDLTVEVDVRGVITVIDKLPYISPTNQPQWPFDSPFTLGEPVRTAQGLSYTLKVTPGIPPFILRPRAGGSGARAARSAPYGLSFLGARVQVSRLSQLTINGGELHFDEAMMQRKN